MLRGRWGDEISRRKKMQRTGHRNRISRHVASCVSQSDEQQASGHQTSKQTRKHRACAKNVWGLTPRLRSSQNILRHTFGGAVCSLSLQKVRHHKISAPPPALCAHKCRPHKHFPRYAYRFKHTQHIFRRGAAISLRQIHFELL